MKTCIIPVRKGSERLPSKNFLLLNGKMVFEWIVEKAIEAKVFDKIVLSSDSEIVKEYCYLNGLEFHQRGENLASSSATSDKLVSTWLSIYNSNIYWLNPVNPYTLTSEIKEYCELFEESDAFSGVTCRKYYQHAFIEASKPINFSYIGGFSRTQDLIPLTILNYAIMSWKPEMKMNLENGVLFDENTFYFESSKESSFMLKDIDDYNILKKIMHEKN